MVICICVGIICSIFVGELCIKNYIERNIGDNQIEKKLRGLLLIRKYHNKGAVLNLGEKKRSVVAGVSVALTVLALVLFVFSLGRRGNHMLRVGLALLLGGGFSNTYDRLKRRYVVDYVSFGVKWNKLRGIVFNISDFCIIIGALLTALGAGR